MANQPETLLEFPCEFPIKVFGLASDDFQASVVAIVQRHAQLAPGDAIQRRQSQGGRLDAGENAVHSPNALSLP